MTRPTGDELQAMSDAEFTKFLRRSGIAVARPGWSGRFREVVAALVTLATFVLLLVALFGLVLLTAAATDTLP